MGLASDMLGETIFTTYEGFAVSPRAKYLQISHASFFQTDMLHMVFCLDIVLYNESVQIFALGIIFVQSRTFLQILHVTKRPS